MSLLGAGFCEISDPPKDVASD